MKRRREKLSKHEYIRRRVQHDPRLNPRYLASCHGKIRYTKDQREQALSNRPVFIKFYKCTFCEWYHIGRSKRK